MKKYSIGKCLKNTILFIYIPCLISTESVCLCLLPKILYPVCCSSTSLSIVVASCKYIVVYLATLYIVINNNKATTNKYHHHHHHHSPTNSLIATLSIREVYSGAEEFKYPKDFWISLYRVRYLRFILILLTKLFVYLEAGYSKLEVDLLGIDTI